MKNKMFKIKKKLLSVTLALLMMLSTAPFGLLKTNVAKAAPTYKLENFIPLIEDINSYNNYDNSAVINYYVTNKNAYGVDYNSDIYLHGIFVSGAHGGYKDEKVSKNINKKIIGYSKDKNNFSLEINLSEEDYKDNHYSIKTTYISNYTSISVPYVWVSQAGANHKGEEYYYLVDSIAYYDSSKKELKIDKTNKKATVHIPKPETQDSKREIDFINYLTIPKNISVKVNSDSVVDIEPILSNILSSISEGKKYPKFIPDETTVKIEEEPVEVKCKANYIYGDDLAENKDLTSSAEITLNLIPSENAGSGHATDLDASHLTDKISELEKQVSALNDTINSQKKELDKINAQNPLTEKEIKSLQKEKNALEEKVKESNDSINTLKDKLSVLETKSQSQDESILELNKKLSELAIKNEALSKELTLAKAKEDAKTEIKAIKDLTAEQIAELEKKVDEATSDEAVKAIIEEAKEEALRKAKEEEIAKAKEEALKKAKEEELAKELAKKNENDPAYQKDKLNKLLEEAKRVRHPSEELEAAIDEAYDILFDKYARLEDYKYAIEKIERILQNRRDTRRNRFKLDVDDLNEKDTELTGKTGAKWYIDVYNGKKCILSGQANYKGDFSIEIKKGKIKAKDNLKVVATDPQDDKKYKEVEIEVTGKANEAKEQKDATSIDDLLQADGSNSLSDLAVFPVGKNFYNVVQNNQKTTVYMDVTTFISGNRTMLPMRYIAYALGFNVEYDSITREAIFSNTENSSLVKKTIRVNIDTGLMRDSDGRIYASDVRPVLINNRIHASIANIARMFNASQGTIEDGISQTIEWDNARKAVYVFKNVR